MVGYGRRGDTYGDMTVAVAVTPVLDQPYQGREFDRHAAGGSAVQRPGSPSTWRGAAGRAGRGGADQSMMRLPRWAALSRSPCTARPSTVEVSSSSGIST